MCLGPAAALAVPAHASTLALGMQDDSSLALWPDDAAGLMALGRDRGVSAVRFIVYPHQPVDRFAAATALAAGQGLKVEVTLASGGLGPEPYRRWALATARRLRQQGAGAFSVLNEPDLTLPSGDACDADSAPEVVRRQGLTVMRRAAGPRTRRRTRVRYRIVHRWSRRPPRRRIAVRVRVRVARRVAPVVVTGDMVSTTGLTSAATAEVSAICRRIVRARVAGDYYRLVIPALRTAVPGAEVWIGETSPVYGVQQFLETLFREPLPAADGFAHHPYARWDGLPSDEDGSLWLDHLGRLPALIDGLPLYLTEFGVMAGESRRRIVDAEGAARIWRAAIRGACAVGARQLVAYQWDPNPPGEDPWRWDTSILGPDRASTPALEAFAGARCAPAG